MHTVGKGIKCSIYCEDFICLSPPSKLKIAVLPTKYNFVKCYSVLSDFDPMTNNDYVT